MSNFKVYFDFDETILEVAVSSRELLNARDLNLHYFSDKIFQKIVLNSEFVREEIRKIYLNHADKDELAKKINKEIEIEAVKILKNEDSIYEQKKSLFDKFFDRELKVSEIEFKDDEFKEKNKLFFEWVAEGNRIVYVDNTLDVRNSLDDFYYDCIVVVKEGVPNAMPVPVLAEILNCYESEIYNYNIHSSVLAEDYNKMFKSYYQLLNVL